MTDRYFGYERIPTGKIVPIIYTGKPDIGQGNRIKSANGNGRQIYELRKLEGNARNMSLVELAATYPLRQES